MDKFYLFAELACFLVAMATLSKALESARQKDVAMTMMRLYTSFMLTCFGFMFWSFLTDLL